MIALVAGNGPVKAVITKSGAGPRKYSSTVDLECSANQHGN